MLLPSKLIYANIRFHIVKFSVWERFFLLILSFFLNMYRDLARVYKVTTSQLNQQVKRNIARFPANFRFQLSEAERDEVVTPILGAPVILYIILRRK